VLKIKNARDTIPNEYFEFYIPFVSESFASSLKEELKDY